MELRLSGLYDVQDRQPVLMPDESIAKMYGLQKALQVMRPEYGRRFLRLLATAELIDNIRAGAARMEYDDGNS